MGIVTTRQVSLLMMPVSMYLPIGKELDARQPLHECAQPFHQQKVRLPLYASEAGAS
jgi:hypothetical protein